MSEYTKGPWKVEYLTDITALHDNKIFDVAHVYMHSGSSMPAANARLIAAAPALLEALEDLIPYFEGEHHPDHPQTVAAYKAIKLAKGEA